MAPLTIDIPTLPDNPSKLSKDELDKNLLALVGAKSKLARALRDIRRSLEACEKSAKTDAQAKLLADLEALKRLVATEESKMSLPKE